MKSIQRTLGVCAFMLGTAAFAASNQPVKTSEPVYNPATVVSVDGTIMAAHLVPAGSPMQGMHLTVKTKSATLDVYLGPTDFVRIFKTNFPVGSEIEVIGSKVGQTILSRDIEIGAATINLREADGAPNWQNWGVEVDPAAVRYE